MPCICPNVNCKKEFVYFSELKKHLKKLVICNQNIGDIDLYILEQKNIQNIEDKKCMNCNTIYTKKSSLDRHIKNSNCNTIIQELLRKKQIQELKNEIDKIKLQLETAQSTQPVHQVQQVQPIQQIHQEQPVQQVQVIHQTNQTNQTINNLTINNNNNITIIQHINPSGFETLPINLSKPEMLRLLNLGDEGVIEIVKLVCEQDENKNFYKLNMNKNNISYLNNNYKIDICQDKELKDKLLKQCVILTYKMLINCSPTMTSEQIYKINSNLQNISEKMKEEIYNNGLKNIIEYELRNNSKVTKDKITKYTNQIITNPETKEQAKINYNKVLKIKQDTNKNKLPRITLDHINNKLGNPLTLPELEKEFTFNDFDTNRFEYTLYYNYWKKRIVDEAEFINSHPNKTIGDITYFENRKLNINSKLDEMEILNNKMREFDANHNMIITLDNFNVEIALDYIDGW